MTDTIPTDIDTTEDAVAQPIGELEHLDPQSLIIGDNVRTDAGPDKDFLASIKLCRFRFSLAQRTAHDVRIGTDSGHDGELVFPGFRGESENHTVVQFPSRLRQFGGLCALVAFALAAWADL